MLMLILKSDLIDLYYVNKTQIQLNDATHGMNK